jgi:hypothetical protein
MTQQTREETARSSGATARLLLSVTAGALLVNAGVLTVLAEGYGALWTSARWQSAIGGSAAPGIALTWLLLWARGPRAEWLTRMASRVRSVGTRLGNAGAGIFVLLLLILPAATAQSWIKAFEPLTMKVVLWWLLTLAGAVALLGLRSGHRFILLVAFSGILLGVAYQIAGYLPSISTYPLSLGWSEASRYYNASLFLAPRLYGAAAPWPVLHPSRYLMQAVPFLLGDLPLWAHRVWQVLLWIIVTWVTAIALARRAGFESRMARLALAGACYLFLMQGPVYYHLLLSAWIVLLGASSALPRRTFVLVVLASAWAGISRINWYPVPAILAIAIHLLERPMPERQRRAAYFAWPLAYAFAGVVTAFLASRAYAALSGNPIEEFGSSFTSDLLWYRLFPSATYPLGVLPGIFIASAACMALVILWARHHRRGMHPLRWLGLAGALLALFGGGLVVSAKIGGGGNLHNLDAYLVLLLLIVVYMAFDRAAPEAAPVSKLRPPAWLLGAAMLLPVAFALDSGEPWRSPDHEYGKATVAAIRDAATQASQAGQEVLFINERHLIVFDDLPVALEPDYEKVYLMEMAMANNQAYLQAFTDDLANHRFGLIVAGRPSTRLRGSDRMFGDENDVWARRVAAPLVRYYQMAVDLGDLWLMVPR